MKLQIAFCLTALFLSTSAPNLHAAVKTLPADTLKKAIDADFNHLEKLYRHLHANPELSFLETNTAARLAGELQSAGFEVTKNFGGQGIVGLFKNGDGPVLLIRADLDALPVREQTGLAFASKAQQMDTNGTTFDVMHACGHDVHMTVFTGAARFLAKNTNLWNGTLVFIGQPAEERGTGARDMLAQGLFKKFPKPDYALAIHVSAGLQSGKVGYVEGYAMANVNSVDVTIRGVGGHGAYPHKTKDPVVLAAQAVLAYQTIISREIEPIESAVITVGSIHGGTKHNIIPGEVKMQLTLRSYTDEVRQQMLSSIKRISDGLAAAAGLPSDRYPIVELDKNEGTLSLYNDPELTKRLAASLKQWLGADKVIPEKPVMAGEDFGLYGRTAEKIPICLLWVGAVSAENMSAGNLPSLHSAYFAPDYEKTIKTGMTALIASVLELARSK